MDKEKSNIVMIASIAVAVIITLFIVLQPHPTTVYKESTKLATSVDSQPPSFDLPENIPSELPADAPDVPDTQEPYIESVNSLEGMVVANSSSTPLKVYLPTGVLEAGKTYTFYIIPGTDGISSYSYFYDSQNRYITYQKLCSDSICYHSINLSYTIPSYWLSGLYKFKIYDYSTTSWKTYYINVSSNAVKRDLSVYMPTYANAGDYMNITIIPSNYGIYKRIFVYNQDSNYVTGINLNCNTDSYRCYDEVSTFYQIPSTWLPGLYTFQIYDYSEYTWKKYYINISNIVKKFKMSFKHKIEINITPSDKGVYSKIDIHNEGPINSTSYGNYSAMVDIGCGSDICYNDATVTFTVPESWPSVLYSINVYDYSSNSWKKQYFRI